eukprot:1172544-Prymnesium_polylepis.1
MPTKPQPHASIHNAYIPGEGMNAHRTQRPASPHPGTRPSAGYAATIPTEPRRHGVYIIGAWCFATAAGCSA